jgi:transcriptional regulator with XRE-family HTH domain
MTCFQSIPSEYRNADEIASGFPIPATTTVLDMGRTVDRTDFGQRLYDARTKAGLTHVQLAKLVHMAQSTLAELEKIGQGSSKTPQLASACGVSPEWLATGDERPMAGPWPLVGIVTPAEWALLPTDVKEDVLSAAEHYIARYRQKHGSGKSSGPASNGTHQKAA